ncbi:hypothetical protein F4861DRAFT_534974 [Xylaria intraflava]|nr:hypothetical protein F4861DRAFT_534974 [Xylaria intraflava]
MDLDGNDVFSADEEEQDDSPRMSQKDITNMIASMPSTADEDAIAFTARIEKRLMSKSTNAQQLSLKEAKRPRGYQSKQLGGDTLEYLQRVHMSYRVAFGLYLNRDPILPIITKVFRDFPGGADVKENAEGIAYERLRNLCSSWKMKTIQHLEAHIKDMCDQDNVFRDCKDMSTLHNILKGKFNPDNWAEILEPWRKTVNVRASSQRVFRWSRSIYVDLGARLKLYLDWKAIKATERPVEAQWDKEAISHRFDTLTRAPGYQQMRPQKSDIVMVPRQAKRRARKQSNRVNEMIDTVTDPDIFIDTEI